MTTETAAARAAVNYRPGSGFKRCWNCEHFSPAGPGTDPPAGPNPGGSEARSEGPTLACGVLRGPVEPTAICDAWVQMADRAKKRTGFRSALRQHGSFLWDEETRGPGTSGQGGGGGPVGL